MDEFLERWRVPIILILVLAIVTGLIVLYMRWPRSSTSANRLKGSTPAPFVSPEAFPAISTPTPRQLTMKVYVSGAVARPGVYTFSDGERVEDALKAAGGATDAADLSRVNLAQRLRDEGQIVVPRIGETPAPATPGASAPSQSSKVNINTASVSELDALPGIGATYAQRIVDYRTKNGLFQKTNDLVEKKIVPQSTFDKIKDLVEVW